MNKLISTIILTSTLMAVSAYAGPKTVYDVANQHAQQDASNFITIKQTFDEAATKKALEYGNTSINGVLYSQASADGYDALVFTKKNPIKFAKKRKVYLYPITPYLVEYVNLYKKNRGDNNQQLREIRADQRLFDNSIYVVTDEYGRFSFPNMKPGRYFLHAESYLQGEDNVDVETGYTKYIGGGMGVSYETQTRSWSKPVICEMEIEVKPGEKVKQIDARLNTHPLKWAKPISLGK